MDSTCDTVESSTLDSKTDDNSTPAGNDVVKNSNATIESTEESCDPDFNTKRDLNADSNSTPAENDEVKNSDATIESTEESCDPYFYTKRDAFTSEVFKIEIENFQHLVGYAQIKKLLTKKMKLKPHKIKVIGRSPPLVFVTFLCEEDRERALKTICGHVCKGRKLLAKKANPMADPLVKKRKADLSRDSEDAKRAKTDDQIDLPVPVMVKSAVTPLWHLTYEEQLQSKQEEMRKFMTKLIHNLKTVNPVLKKLLPESEGSCPQCPLLPIVASPVTTGYRNKCEFNVGLHPETAQPTVGFRISSYKEGSKCVAEASHCINIPDTMHKAAQLFQEYIQASPLPVFNPENHEGYWRQLTVRTSRKNNLLLIVVFHPQSLSQDEISEEKRKLSEFFSSSVLDVTSLYIQKYVKKERDEPPLEHVSGTTFIEEELLGLNFHISPDSFFQVNTLGAELLYSTVKDFATLTEKTTLLDLCCGTGAIGISLAKNVLKVVGVELCQAAVEDARLNVENNGLDNTEFICGKVEDVVFSVLNKAAEDEDVVAILDPPRAGLSNKVIKAIRGMPRLKRLVYLSCSPQLAFTNFIDLCRPTSNNYRGSPFRPIKSVAVDLFPQTIHCELVLLFERD